MAIASGSRESTQRLIGPVLIDSSTDPLLHPHPGTAGTAAEGSLASPRHLGDRGTREGAEQVAWRIVDLVVPSQIASVVVGDRPSGNRALGRRDRGQPTVAYQPVEQLAVVHHFAVEAKLRILVLESVETVGAGHDDLGRLCLLQRLGILHRELLINELIPGASSRVPCAGLTVAEHGVAHAGNVQQFRDRTGRLLGAIFVRAGAADPEQVLHFAEVGHIFADDWHIERQVLGPVHPAARAEIPGISLAFQAFEKPVELGWELRGHHDLEAAHVEDVINMLDVNRALLDTRTARRAGPEHVRIDDARYPVGHLDWPNQRSHGLCFGRFRQRGTG